MQVKTQLAEKAVEAAKAAEDVLTRKKVIVDELQEEVKEAQSVVQEESTSLEQEQVNVNAAVQAARQSQDRSGDIIRSLMIEKNNCQKP